MSETPSTQYAQAADGVHLAYQVSGEGPLDLVFAPGITVSIDLLWDDPGMLRVARRLGNFSRVVWGDLRGWGSSEGSYVDRTSGEISDGDLAAVLDAAGCEQIVLMGSSLSGQNVIHFAATHPERVKALVLFNSFAHYLRHVDYPYGLPPETLEPYLAVIRESWGSGSSLGAMAPSRVNDERFRAWMARCERLGAGPDESATRTRGMFALDYRLLLPAIEVPTLVLHRRRNRFIRVEAGRYLAEHIPGAKYVELPGDDQFFFVGDVDAWLDEVEDFLTGHHQPAEGDVVLATVLFTDIVNSTAQQSAMGHRGWGRLMEEHDALVRGALGRHRGRAIKAMGDGVLATFDATTGAVRCALEIVQHARAGGLELRAGLHTGEVEVRTDDVAGLAVTIAKRICDLAAPGQVLVSRTVTDVAAGSGLTFEDSGDHALKGVRGTWRLYGVES